MLSAGVAIASHRSQPLPHPCQLPAHLTTVRFILLLGVQMDLFTACFGQDAAWPCELKSLGENSSAMEVLVDLNDSNILCCIVQHFEMHWNLEKSHYDKGGFVVYFGIYEEFNDPAKLSQAFGVQWRFSAYTTHEHQLSSVGIQWLGDEVTAQQYTNSNMSVCLQKIESLLEKNGILEEYLYDNCFDTSVEFDNLDDEDKEEYESARDLGYPWHCQEMENKASLAMHVNPSIGGKIVYHGFVNDNGNIPKFVRALLTGGKTQSH